MPMLGNLIQFHGVPNIPLGFGTPTPAAYAPAMGTLPANPPPGFGPPPPAPPPNGNQFTGTIIPPMQQGPPPTIGTGPIPVGLPTSLPQPSLGPPPVIGSGPLPTGLPTSLPQPSAGPAPVSMGNSGGGVPPTWPNSSIFRPRPIQPVLRHSAAVGFF